MPFIRPHLGQIVLYNVGPEDDQILRCDYIPQCLPAVIVRVIAEEQGVVDLRILNNGLEAPPRKPSVFPIPYNESRDPGKLFYRWMRVEDLVQLLATGLVL